MRGLNHKARWAGLTILGGIVAATGLWAAADGQFGQRFGGRGDRRNFGRETRGDDDIAPPRRNIFPGNVFTFCTFSYTQVAREARGFGWSTDYPDAGYHFMLRLAEVTTIPIARRPNGEPRQIVLSLTDEALFDYPYIFSSDVGTMGLDEDERDALRNYLLRGGFMHVDDFWGDLAWRRWEYEIGQVLPPEEYPIEEVPLSDPLFHIVFDIKEVPQVPSIRFWSQTGGATSERGAGSEKPGLYGIRDRTGRLMVVMTHNTDIADGWEREQLDYGYFEEFSVKKSYPLGINIVVYAMTH